MPDNHWIFLDVEHIFDTAPLLNGLERRLPVSQGVFPRHHRLQAVAAFRQQSNGPIHILIIATLNKGKHDKQQKNGLSTLPKTPPGCKKGGVFA